MKLTYVIPALILAASAVPASAQLPTPPMAQATRTADAYLFHAGAGDVFEITSSMMAIQNSTNPQVRAFATHLIADHSNLTNTTLATAKSAGVMPPPPELSPQQKAMITQLMSAGANFDRVYLQQQQTAHQQALAMQQGYARSGDVPALRQGAAASLPIIEGHIAEVRQLMRSVR